MFSKILLFLQENYHLLILLSVFISFVIKDIGFNIRFGFFVLAIFISPLFINLYDVIENIGSDSLSEASNFSTEEAKFYLWTILYSLKPSLEKYIFLIIAIGSLSFLVFVLRVKFRLSKVIFSLSLIYLGVVCYKAYESVHHSILETETITHNFSKPKTFTISSGKKDKMDVIVYIGESTSKVNMSSYGYFRKTTPNLDKYANDKNAILFQNIFSTHSHTSQSLLEALSVSNSHNQDKDVPIFKRVRTSIVDILAKSGVNTYLYSNQGVSGTWNLVSSVIFGKSHKKVFYNSEKMIGNLQVNPSSLQYDHTSLAASIDEMIQNKGVSFFHSYAGHGPYCAYISEEFKVNVDDQLKDLKSSSITGSMRISDNDIECYDSAMRYIDNNIKTVVERIKDSKDPKVFIYFSDHGESLYTGRGHDSSRISLDMLSIPLFVYFNDAAMEHIDITQYDESSLRTLPFISYFLFDLLDIEVSIDYQMDPILIRDTLKGSSYLDLTSTSNYNWLTNQFVHRSQIQSGYSCLHRVNNLGRMIVGGLAFDCLEFDVVINDDDIAYIDHDYPADSRLTLDIMMKHTLRNRKDIWIDAKNIDTLDHCLILSKSLIKANRDVLVEFPPESVDSLPQLSSCFKELEGKTTFISYYVPKEQLLSCHKGDDDRCKELRALLLKIKKSGYFNSVSFDYIGIDFMLSQRDILEGMSFHSWIIHDMNDPRLAHIDMAITTSDSMTNESCVGILCL